MENLKNGLTTLISYTEWTMLLFVVGGGLFLVLYSRGRPYRYFIHAIKVISGKYDNPEDKGQISHLQALSSAVAATVGLGNISGVAIAIHLGGPGVVFWMWATAFIGICIKFYSCSLAVMYRGTDSKGAVLGGPMFYIVEGMGPWAKGLAVFFCAAGLFGVLPVFTVNQFTQTIMTVVQPEELIYDLDPFYWKLIIGIILVLLTVWVISGGLQKIVKVATSMVPFMVMLYFFAVIYILFLNPTKIIPSLGLIVTEAFNWQTMVQGGFWGLLILGVRRAVFSNESGVGNAPMYHGQSKTSEPIHEGLTAMMGPFIDTFIVCTLTAVVIIMSGTWVDSEANGIVLTLKAFETLLGTYGDDILMILVISFALSTLFTYSYYGTKCLGFLAGERRGKYYNIFYVASITFAAVASVDLVLGVIDLAFALMVIPNMIAVIYLAPRVNKAMKVYFNKRNEQRT